jgi:pimeloyl-ACP methyl ester carboxylesterase
MHFKLDAGDATLVGEAIGFGPLWVLLHAGAEQRRVWDPTVEWLVAAGQSCVTLDLRGHGQSGGSRDQGFEPLVRDVDRLRAFIARPAVYVGASLGGLSALAMVARLEREALDHIVGLVLVDVVPDPNPQRVLEGLTESLGAAVGQSAIVREILGKAEALRAAARSLSVPTLLVRAEHSFGVRDDDAERFALLVPHAAQVTVAASSHLVARDQPLALARELLAFAVTPDVAARWGTPGDSLRARVEAWLTQHRAHAIDHLAGTLHEHLRRTVLWLERWNAPEHVQLAGLCHAAYGTDGFATALVEEREGLRALIGDRAEALVYSYCACERDHLYSQLGSAELTLRDRFTGQTRVLAAEEIDDFALLTLANELDVMRHGRLEPALRTSIEALVRGLRAHRSVEADRALAASACVAAGGL